MWDPGKWLFDSLQDFIVGILETVLPWLTSALKPDFSAQWFLQAYMVSFGISVLVMGILALTSLVGRARRRTPGRSVIDSLFVMMPAFIIGAMFGPAIGIAVINLLYALIDSIVLWGFGSTVTDVYTQLGERWASTDIDDFAGGVIAADLTLLIMSVAMIGAVLVYVVQLATTYLMGSVGPLGWVWIIDPRTRRFGSRVPVLMLGILASPVLLFLLLGFAVKFMGGLLFESTVAGQDGAVVLVNFGTTAVLFCLAVFAPLSLLKIGKLANPGGGAGSMSNAAAPNLPTPSAHELANRGARDQREHANTPDTQPASNGSPSPTAPSQAGTAPAGTTKATESRPTAKATSAQSTATTTAAKTGAQTGAKSGAAASSAASAVPVAMLLAGAAKTASIGFRRAHEAAVMAGEAADDREY